MNIPNKVRQVLRAKRLGQHSTDLLFKRGTTWASCEKQISEEIDIAVREAAAF